MRTRKCNILSVQICLRRLEWIHDKIGETGGIDSSISEDVFFHFDGNEAWEEADSGQRGKTLKNAKMIYSDDGNSFFEGYYNSFLWIWKVSYK